MRISNAQEQLNTVIEAPNVRRETFKVPKEDLPALADVSLGKDVDTVARNLNSLLANEFTVFTKTLNFHWNVTGPRFHSMHKFLDDQYQDLLVIVDNVAERIREIGANPMGTLTEMRRVSTLSESPGIHPKTSIMLAELVADHESIQGQIKSILKEIKGGENDPGTEDFLTSLLKKHEEMTWMLKSHIEG